MNKLKILSSFAATLIFTTSVMAGGDPRDFGPVESFDSITISSNEIIEQATIGETAKGSAVSTDTTLGLVTGKYVIKNELDTYVGKIDSGIVITEKIHNTCKDKLNLSESNIARFKEALFSGNLYNIGPFDALGTLFSPSRWDNYFDCVEMHSNVSI